MTKPLSPFDQALHAWLDCHERIENGVHIVDFAGRLCVIKIRRPSFLGALSYSVRFVRASLLSLFCWWAFRERPSPRVLLRNGVEAETERLLALHAQGYPAPDVLYYAKGILVLAFVGENLPTRIRKSSPQQRLILMDLAARDLAKFHQAGFVHGGAQLRNIMIQDDQLTRIDYEENIAEALSQKLGQAYDVYQMISSMAGLSGEQFSEQERRALCARLLSAYLHAHPDPAVRSKLSRFGQLFSGVQRYTGWLLRRLPGRDIRGFLYVTDTLRL